MCQREGGDDPQSQRAIELRFDQVLPSLGNPGGDVAFLFPWTRLISVLFTTPAYMRCLIRSSLSVLCSFLQYPVRVAQCEEAKNEIKKRHPEVDLLRDVSLEQVIFSSI